MLPSCNNEYIAPRTLAAVHEILWFCTEQSSHAGSLPFFYGVYIHEWLVRGDAPDLALCRLALLLHGAPASKVPAAVKALK